jgi:hypothetical protein
MNCAGKVFNGLTWFLIQYNVGVILIELFPMWGLFVVFCSPKD